MKADKLARTLAVALCCLSLLSCGGDPDEDVTPPPTSVSVGTITGFGSVIVNGVRFDDRGATVTINDQAATSSQLKVGMVVEVQGSTAACPNADVQTCEGIASRIRFRNNLEGPITAINRLTNTVQVMGRDVVVDDATVIDGSTASDLTALAIGHVVAVSGFTEQNRIRARLLERVGVFVDGTTPIQLYGLTANVNTAFGTCTVDGVQVRFQGLAAADLPAGGMADGQYVQVQGRQFGSGVMTADRIRLRDRISFPDASLVQLEGYVSGFVSVANFIVGNQQVDASSAVFRNGSASDLRDGVKVEVEGTMDGTVLVASKLIFRLEANAQVVAPIQRLGAAAGSLVLLGQAVLTTPLTQFIDQSSTGPVRTMDYADLAAGDRVDVRAYVDDAGALVATRVARTDPDPRLIAKGAVDATVPETGLTLLGIDVRTGAATRYRDALGDLITDTEFFDQLQLPPALPSIVRAQGVASTGSASEIDATRAASTRGEVEIAR